eukprot:Gb_37093 [translate_table: standard]
MGGFFSALRKWMTSGKKRDEETERERQASADARSRAALAAQQRSFRHRQQKGLQLPQKKQKNNLQKGRQFLIEDEEIPFSGELDKPHLMKTGDWQVSILYFD